MPLYNSPNTINGPLQVGSAGAATGTTLYVGTGSSGFRIFETGGSEWFSVGRVASGVVGFNLNGGYTLLGPGATQIGTARLSLLTGNDISMGIGIRGNSATQSADLFQLQDSAGVILTAFQANGTLVFGPSGAQDTNLYRSAANTLKTDDTFISAASVLITGSSASAYIGQGANNYYNPADNGGRAGIVGAASVYINIDSNNDTTNASFLVYKDSNVLSSGTQLLALGEAGQLALPVTGSTGGLLIGGDTNLYRSAADKLATDDDFLLNTVGNGLYIKEGTNATMGTATLSAGTATVSTTKVTANSRIFLTVDGGTLTNVGAPYISARTAGTSFVITSTNILDASNVAWVIIEPS